MLNARMACVCVCLCALLFFCFVLILCWLLSVCTIHRHQVAEGESTEHIYLVRSAAAHSAPTIRIYIHTYTRFIHYMVLIHGSGVGNGCRRIGKRDLSAYHTPTHTHSNALTRGAQPRSMSSINRRFGGHDGRTTMEANKMRTKRINRIYIIYH